MVKKKLLISVLMVSACALLTGVAAFAQTDIDPGSSTGGQVTLTALGGGSASVGIGTCNTASCTSTVTLAGASATIAGTTSGGTASLTYSTGAAGDITIAASPLNSDGTFPVNMNGATLQFDFTATNVSFGNLVADLSLTGIKDGTSSPDFEGTLSFVSGSGSLASTWGAGGVVKNITIDLGPGVTVDGLLGCPPGSSSGCTAIAKGTSETADFSHGEFSPAPEPASMLLFGSGLLGLGSFLRRRFRA